MLSVPNGELARALLTVGYVFVRHPADYLAILHAFAGDDGLVAEFVHG